MLHEFDDINAAAKITAEGLKYILKMGKGLIPEPAFTEGLKIFPGTSLEVVPIHIDGNGNLSVYLLQRKTDDAIKEWRGKWHSPGTMIRKSDGAPDNSLRKAWDRLSKEEFMSEALGEPIDVETIEVSTERGLETARIHVLRIPNNLSVGKYINLNDLDTEKNTIIKHHLVIIGEAARNLVGLILSGRLNIGRQITTDFQRNLITSSLSSLKYLNI